MSLYDTKYFLELNVIERYCKLLLSVLGYVCQKGYPSQEALEIACAKKLKFRSYKEVLQLRACIDLLEDTQHAIEDVYANGFETKEISYGERYLRLYGVLNACYLQLGAMKDLMRMFEIQKQAEYHKQLKNAGIIKLRNKIASHTTGYIADSTTKNLDFFRVTQTSLTKWSERLAIVGHEEKYEEVDLIPMIRSFTSELVGQLKVICVRAGNVAFRNNKKFKEDFFIAIEIAASK